MFLNHSHLNHNHHVLRPSGTWPERWGKSRYHLGEGKVSGDLIVTFLIQKEGYRKDGVTGKGLLSSN